jgi:hypothetical protein
MSRYILSKTKKISGSLFINVFFPETLLIQDKGSEWLDILSKKKLEDLIVFDSF